MKDSVFLVVDDDGQVRDILVEYLNSFGFANVLAAKDGKAAIKIIQNPQQRLDVVISDWEMPHIDGLTLLRAVRKDPVRKNVKFVMVSSQSSHERMKISKAAKSHVDAYIVKPFRAHILREKIETILQGNVDESSKAFEDALNQKITESEKVVPANNGVPHGKVIVKEDDSPVGAVSVVTEANADVGRVTQISDPDAPPETYDLAQMNVGHVCALAKAYKKAKWFDQSIQLCKEAIGKFTNSADLTYQLAEAYFLKSEFDEALRHLKEVIRIEPYHVEAHSLISEINQLRKVS